ncbi:unnamed protein product [Adineta ricciae]|uniref:DYW domain-containing protein n=1 Tax=Adineta ricciae TaxID=249248 RepID=A0A814F021_ADIRI|nr:unnamed protein product [Adineta ricciae]CAF0976289.1 unnamed protein product [Adineta ricciae]
MFSTIQHLLLICRHINRFSSSSSSSMKLGLAMKQLIDSKQYEKVLKLYAENCKSCNHFSIDMTLKACIKLNDDQHVKTIEKNLTKELLNNPFVQTSLLQFYIQRADIDQALNICSRIDKKSNYLYTVLFKGLIAHNKSENVLDLYDKMTIKPDDFTLTVIFNACTQLANERAKIIGNKLLNQILNKDLTNNVILLTSAINMLMNFGEVKDAERLFQLNKSKDTIIYGTMMKGYNNNDQPLRSLQLFQQMKNEKIKLDEIKFLLLINACSQIGILSICQQLVDQIPSHCFNNIQINTSLIDMWGKAGSVKNAQHIFESIKNPDIISYNTMINAYGLNFMGLEAVRLYERIPNHLHSEISYICVLNACSHSGLVHQAYQIFNQIPNKTERIITTMVDCLSRLFLFDEAQKLIDEYEKTNLPSVFMYMTILSGVRNHRNSVLSEKIYEKMKVLFPNEKDRMISGSILLGNIYNSLGDSNRAEEIRSNRRKNFGNELKPGLSWTEVNGEIVEFKAHDRSHPRSKEIYEELNKISSELIAYGHEYDATWITRSLREDETVESVLCGHSEKLAIALNFVARTNPALIQITENLRVCGDCHNATKLIAKIRKCQIIVRDSNCIHHFHTNGQCSCQDHF